MNLTYAKLTLDKFQTFSSLYTKDERLVVSELLKEAAMRLRHEAPTPWRSPIWEEPEQSRVWPPTAHCHHSQSNYQIANVFKGAFARRLDKSVVSDAMVRSVVYGSHIIPGAQTAESILLRMAGEYQREEVNRKASRAERIDVPLSFAMTLTAVLATFARLECSTSFKRYASRSASKRRSNPHASIMLKTKYDGVKLSFWITLHGEAPCTVLFRRPRIFSLRKIEDYATLATEAKDILAQFGRDVVGCKD